MSGGHFTMRSANKRYRESDPKLTRFIFAQQNVLTDKCADNDPVHGFPRVPREVLAWPSRHASLVSKLKEADAFCLEECTPSDWNFDNDFPDHEYYGSTGGNHHGVYLFWNRKKFHATTKIDKRLSGTNQVVVFVNLEFMEVHSTLPAKFRSVLFVGTHLKAKAENELVRIEQACAIIEHIRPFIDIADFTILCGDLNCEPGSIPHRILTFVSGIYYDPFNDHRIEIDLDPLESKYPTTKKFRAPKEGDEIECIKKTEDYILLNTPHMVHLAEACIRPDLKNGNIKTSETGLPDKAWPSDHCQLSVCIDIDSTKYGVQM
jgi:mRNA deadenylase 3'-5' endonuclease subunit Ccr4